MTWYEDPNGVAQRVTAAVGALLALLTALPGFVQGSVDASALMGPIGVLVSTGVALWAIRAARKRAFAPATVATMLAPSPEAPIVPGGPTPLPEPEAVRALRSEAERAR